MEHDFEMTELCVLKNGIRKNDPEGELINQVKFQLVLANTWIEVGEFSILKTRII